MNNQDFTKEQNDNLKTWAGQRDSLLFEISTLRTENEKLQKLNNELTASHTTIISDMNLIKGRIEELKVRENELPLIISKEVASLQSKKSTLEAEVLVLEKLAEVLTSKKTSLEADVSFALSAFGAVKDETFSLDKIVDRVTAVSQDNSNKIDLLVKNLAKSLEEIIEVNRKNVLETNVVIEKLPTMLMEAQKHGLIKPRQSIIKK